MKGRHLLAAALVSLALASPASAEPDASTASDAPSSTSTTAVSPATRPDPVIINAAPAASVAAPAAQGTTTGTGSMTAATVEGSKSASQDEATTAPTSDPPTAAETPETADRAKAVDPSAAPSASPETTAPPPAGETKAEQAAAPPPPPTLIININLTTQRMTVSENGTTKHTWAVSSARAGYKTPTGTFKPQWMSRMWYSRQYDWSPMPHAIFFSGGTAIHATYATRMLGHPASHGCVRLAPGNAAALYKLVGRHGKDRTRIVVDGVPKHRNAPVAEKRTNRRDYAGVPRGYRYMPRYAYSEPYFYARPPRYAYGDPYYAPPRRYYTKPRRYVQRGYYSGYRPGYDY